ncbi:unnamed protein product [Eruca vesicaria subsp. sativa]|uniref:Uncharacterized protein n=1 Tax=Eruca vesicaria subsp. sativa TaxID=29727 RepID=A0ABC8JRD1_ERUVS|nr:unnamed protein product [Eruca vesicaria subsp. sativa]
MARHLEDVISMATRQQHSFICCVLSAKLLSCADRASDNIATSGNTPAARGCGGAGCGGGCGDLRSLSF